VAVDPAALCGRTTDFAGDLVRNIKSIRVSQNLFDDLADSAAAVRVAQTAESRARIPSAEPLITRPFDYGSVITWSFRSEHWQASRFSDGTRYGVWYGALDLETTVYETVFHWHRFLMDSFPQEDRVITGERRAFDVKCEALLIDLRGREREAPELVGRRSYAFTQALGRHLVERGQSGLLVRSARCEGVNAAILEARRLSGVRDRAMLTYRCNPTQDRVVVERTPGRRWLTIAPSTLA
jgi:hypothetical protein